MLRCCGHPDYGVVVAFFSKGEAMEDIDTIYNNAYADMLNIYKVEHKEDAFVKFCRCLDIFIQGMISLKTSGRILDLHNTNELIDKGARQMIRDFHAMYDIPLDKDVTRNRKARDIYLTLAHDIMMVIAEDMEEREKNGI